MGYIPQLRYDLPSFGPCAVDLRHEVTVISAELPNEAMHIHDTCEIYVNVTGDGTFMVENSFYPVTRGDIILTAPNEMHHGVWQEGVRHEHYCIWFPAGENTPWLTRFFDRPRGQNNLLSLSPPEKEKLLRALERMERELGEGGDRRRATASFLQILLQIESAEAEQGEKTDLPHPLPEILSELAERIAEPLRMTEIAERHFISQSTLNRLFQAHLRVSPHAYVENLRLARAKRLLAAGCDVTDTALECGFSDSSYFILLFRRRFGETPGKYRKQSHQKGMDGTT